MDLYWLVAQLQKKNTLKSITVKTLTAMLQAIPFRTYTFKDGTEKVSFKRKDHVFFINHSDFVKVSSNEKHEQFKNQFVNVYYIKKKGGGHRRIISYDDYLLNILQGIREILQPAVEKCLPPQLCGCVTGNTLYGICNDIYQTMDKKTVLCHLDVQKWFDYIRKDHVEKVLSQYMEDETEKSILAEILTYKGRLPQGSPCSPMIANSVANITWAPSIIEYCEKHNLFLRIYVDNIIFTCNDTLEEAKTHINNIDNLLREHRFYGHKKSRALWYRKQKVLGMILNDDGTGPRVPKQVKRNIGVILYKASFLQDKWPIIETWIEKYDGRIYLSKLDIARTNKFVKFNLRKRFYSWIMGHIAWIGHAERDHALAEKYREQAHNYFYPFNLHR